MGQQQWLGLILLSSVWSISLRHVDSARLLLQTPPTIANRWLQLPSIFPPIDQPIIPKFNFSLPPISLPQPSPCSPSLPQSQPPRLSPMPNIPGSIPPSSLPSWPTFGIPLVPSFLWNNPSPPPPSFPKNIPSPPPPSFLWTNITTSLPTIPLLPWNSPSPPPPNSQSFTWNNPSPLLQNNPTFPWLISPPPPPPPPNVQTFPWTNLTNPLPTIPSFPWNFSSPPPPSSPSFPWSTPSPPPSTPFPWSTPSPPPSTASFPWIIPSPPPLSFPQNNPSPPPPFHSFPWLTSPPASLPTPLLPWLIPSPPPTWISSPLPQFGLPLGSPFFPTGIQFTFSNFTQSWLPEAGVKITWQSVISVELSLQLFVQALMKPITLIISTIQDTQNGPGSWDWKSGFTDSKLDADIGALCTTSGKDGFPVKGIVVAQTPIDDIVSTAVIWFTILFNGWSKDTPPNATFDHTPGSFGGFVTNNTMTNLKTFCSHPGSLNRIAAKQGQYVLN